MSRNILIVYFSFSDNIASEVKRLCYEKDADLIRLEPRNPYPEKYDERRIVIEKEIRLHHVPELKTQIPDLKKYNEIYLGYPSVFGSHIPMIVHAFFSSFNLEGKTVIPFSEVIEEPLRATMCEITELAQKHGVKIEKREI